MRTLNKSKFSGRLIRCSLMSDPPDVEFEVFSNKMGTTKTFRLTALEAAKFLGAHPFGTELALSTSVDVEIVTEDPK